MENKTNISSHLGVGGQNLSHHKLTDYSWYDIYAEKMGEESLRAYVDKVYISLNKLVLGSHIDILKHVAPERYDLFIKVCCLYITETKAWNYEFNNEYTKITHRYDAREMEELHALFAKQRREKELGGDGTGVGTTTPGVENVSAPAQDVPRKG